MTKIVSAKCPNCGASLKLSNEKETIKCEYCKNTIIVDEAIACFKFKISGNISVDGITTNAELIKSANELLDMNEYLKAKRKFLEFSEKCPDNYQGWLGLLICRTRNFTIKDNNIMFENDVNKYRDHFFRVAPKNIKEQYFETIDRYFDPEKYIKMKEQEKNEKRLQELDNLKKKTEERKKQLSEKKKNYKNEIRESSAYKKASEFGNKGKNFIFKIYNINLYIFGCLIVLAFIPELTKDFISSFLTILFGLSLFKVFYTFIEKKFNINKKYISIARFMIPVFLMILAASFTPVNNDESNNKEHNNVNEEEASVEQDNNNNDKNG